MIQVFYASPETAIHTVCTTWKRSWPKIWNMHATNLINSMYMTTQPVDRHSWMHGAQGSSKNRILHCSFQLTVLNIILTSLPRPGFLSGSYTTFHLSYATLRPSLSLAPLFLDPRNPGTSILSYSLPCIMSLPSNMKVSACMMHHWV